MDTGKKLIVKIGAIFIGALLFLTFFSSTIYSFNLPSVVVEYPREGALSSSASGRGSVDFAVKDAYYAEVAGKVYLLVAEGETVAEGRALYTIAADVEDWQRSLEEYRREEDTLQLRLQKARTERAQAQQGVSGAALSAAQQEAADARLLYEAGVISLRELEEKQTALVEADFRYRQELAEAEQAAVRLQYQIDECELELTGLRQKIARLQEQPGAQGEITVTAASAGMVRQIGGGLESGAWAAKNELIMKIGVAEGGFMASFELPGSADYLKIGDTVTVNIGSGELHGISGEITGLLMIGGRLQAETRFAAQNVSGGEAAEIKVANTSQLYPSILPNSALRSDSYGDHVLYVEAVKGFFGYEYYACRTNVWLEDQNNYNAAIRVFNSEEKLPVIVNSDKPVSEGDRVRIVGGSDLVEIR